MIRKLWFDEPPTQSGYYWFKDAESGDADVAHVKRGNVRFLNGLGWKKLADAPAGKWSAPIPFPSLHRANKHESGLKELTEAVVDCLAALDYVMEQRESPERGQVIAKIANHLNHANDAAMHFALGMSFDKIEELKRKRERLRIKARKAKANAG
jgi:hypothetical protein